jgi:hypothetical protein
VPPIVMIDAAFGLPPLPKPFPAAKMFHHSSFLTATKARKMMLLMLQPAAVAPFAGLLSTLKKFVLKHLHLLGFVS